MSIKQTNSGLEIKITEKSIKNSWNQLRDRVQQRLDFYQMKIQ